MVEYARHATTELFCVAWRIGTKRDLRDAPIEYWSPAIKGSKIDEFLSALLNPNILLCAHNAGFETAITRYTLSRILNKPELENISHERFLCTASMAASLALPRSLEGACSALSLPVQKDIEGRRLIMKYTKPRRATKFNDNKWHSSLSDLKRIIEYCKHDIEAETELLLSIPDLIDRERMVWLLNQRVNFRGFTVDRELVTKCLKLIDIENKNIQQKTFQLTNGAVESTTQRDNTLNWLASKGVVLPNLQAKTVYDVIKEAKIDPIPLEVLKLRQAGSRTSTAKYAAFEERSRSDGRCRDNLIYHGASTGRESGTGVQVQNFPRGTEKNSLALCEFIKQNELEDIRFIYGEPMKAFSNALRGCIIASPGKELFCADFNAIEVRVLFWVANHTKGLRAFTEKRDLYKEMAAIIFNKKIEDVTDSERHLGKTVILGAGYGLGVMKFFESCNAAGTIISEELAESSIQNYRNTHSAVPLLWKNLEKAAVYAVLNPKKVVSINHTKWFMRNDFLVCELPSGRCLSYYKPVVKNEYVFKKLKPVLYHWGSNSVTKKWELQKTWGGTLTENVVQAIARDLMVEAQYRVEVNGYDLLLSVHDELLAEREINFGDLEEFENLMSEIPEWAPGCPVVAKGWRGNRYRK